MCGFIIKSLQDHLVKGIAVIFFILLLWADDLSPSTL